MYSFFLRYKTYRLADDSALGLSSHDDVRWASARGRLLTVVGERGSGGLHGGHALGCLVILQQHTSTQKPQGFITLAHLAMFEVGLSRVVREVRWHSEDSRFESQRWQ
jgi:hypothetical protein